MAEANLTRFGPHSIEPEAGRPDVAMTSTFRAVEGAAELSLISDGAAAVQVRVNGHSVAVPELHGGEEVRVPVDLLRDNTIEVSTSHAVTLRVRQVTQADLGLLRQGYFGLNTSDMEKQRQFYELLGFVGEIYPAGPETSTTFARSLGFADDYLIYVSLHSLENPQMPPFVDTVQFRGESFRSEAPYARLNHLGMAYATYSTTDLDGAYNYLQANGVNFLSPPAQAPNGERFVFLQEQDGAFLKLIETTPAAENAEPGANLVRLVNTNMNVSDMERSREFYRLIGFSESVPAAQAGDGEFAAAHGFDSTIRFDGQDISLGEGTDGATLQLRQWQNPYDGEQPYPPPVNHLGIDRINFYVKDLTATVKAMNELGFEQLGPIGGSPEIGIVFFFDPDGIKVQFAGPQTA
ncbi:MAG: VOC family protein [Pseudomonadota bacterium]